jgi:tRNA A-37 threonylcarbamoyl transferase component Bud32/tetratricopeptide (TPR) repeat protein
VTDQLDRLKALLGDRYTIERQIGSGGMATVYLAEDLKHERKVAVKVLRPELAAVLGAERFLQEIKVTANLNHPHILPLHDSGDAGGFLYYVMPYVEGETLRDRLNREGQLPLDDALQITRAVAAALSYAHSHDVIHRDIKPENVLLSAGEAVVADFGIARALSEAGGEHLTETGISIGTPAYMSPEQATGEHRLDGRSDIYSLGCVLYEMLAGEAPFTGPTAQAIVAKKLSEATPRISLVRELVPEAVDQAVVKALAKAPADRYATAEQFAIALATPSGRHTPTGTRPAGAAHRGRRTAIGAVAATGVIVVAVLVAMLLRSRSETGVDPNLLAVAPFDVLSQQDELAVWGEGMMDMLSRSLDGAGPLRTLSPTMSVRRWEGRADAVSAEAFGHRTGAGLVVFGTIVGLGSDSARVAATLFDVERGSALAETELRDRADRVDRLSDSLAVRLLGGLSRTRSIGGTPLYSLGSTSPAAIKTFLQGEVLYRRSSWDSAMVYYERAIDLDSSFALAYRRIGTVLSWNELEFGLGSQAVLPYQLRAGQLNRGLAPRESLLVVAESLYAGLTPSFDGDWSRVDRLLATMERAARRYPEDAEVWYELGEARYHFGESAGVTLEAVYDAFRHSIELDSGFAPAYIHATELALRLEGVEVGRRTLAALLTLGPVGYEAGAAHLAQALLDPARAQSAEVEAALDTLSDLAMTHAITHLQYYPDSAESALRVARALAERSPAGASDLRWQLAFRGHVGESYQVLEEVDWRTPQVRYWAVQSTFAELALLGVFPDDTVRAVYDAWLNANYGEGVYLANRWWADRGDTVSLQRLMRISETRLDQLRGAQDPDTALVGWAHQCATAYLALARGDTAAALGEFEALRDWPTVPWAYKERLTRAQLLMAVGRDEEAATVLEQIPSVGYPPGPVEVMWILERARVNDRLGNREKAVESYAYVADVWRHADPLLQPFVEEARGALARLVGEPRR